MDRRAFVTGGVVLAAAAAMRPQTAHATPSGSSGWFDVKEFGAAGDGHTDDTAAIQSALDAADAATGGLVWIPAGVYRVGTLTLPGAVTVTGTGWQSTLKARAGATGPVLRTAAGRTSYYGVVRDLAVDGAKDETASADAHGILLWGADHWRIDGLRVTNCRGAAIRTDGDPANLTVAPYIRDCYLDSCAGPGLDLNGRTCDAKVHNVDIGLCDKGVVVPNSSFLDGVTVWQCGVGFYGYWAARAHLVHCRAERSRFHGFWLEGCTDTMLEACRAYENNQSGGAYDGFRLSGTSAHPTRRVSLIGCHAGLTGSLFEKQRFGVNDAKSRYVDYILYADCVAAGNTTGGISLAGAHNVAGRNL